MRVELTRRAAKGFLKSPNHIKDQLEKKLDQLKTTPLMGIPLYGELRGLRKIRVGTYRIIYEFDQRNKLITITAMEPRGGVYK